MAKTLKKAPKREAPVIAPDDFSRSHLHFSVGPVKFARVKDMIPGYGLVSLEEAKRNGKFPKIDESMIPPDTYFRVSKNELRSRCLVTVMPNSLLVAWDTCGLCHSYYNLCRCHAGISADRAIEWIFDKWTADKAGEEWDINHRNYYGSFTKAARERRKGRANISRIIPARDVSQIPKKMAPAKKTLRKAAPEPEVQTAPKPKILRKGSDVSKVLTRGTLDIGKLNREASTVQQSAEDEFNERVKKSITKKSLKKGTAK